MSPILSISLAKMEYHNSLSPAGKGETKLKTVFRAGYSYCLKKAVQLLACYMSANVCQAVLLERITSLNFQRSASSQVMDSVVHPCERGSSRRQQFLHRVPSPGILHRPKQKESHRFPSFHQH